jgi:hypothetical protein
VHRCGGGSDARANKSALAPLPYQRRPSRRRLGVGGNVCLSIFQIGSVVFSLFIRSGEIYFSTCRWRLLFSATALGAGRGGCSRARMLVRRWWIYRYSPTSSVGCGGSWSKEARGRPPVDVPQRHAPRCLQRACSSTHKASLAMLLFWIWQWRRLGVSSNVRLDGVGVWHRPLVSASVEKPRDSSVFFSPLGFFLQSVQDNYFLLYCLCFLDFTFVYSCNLIFI